MVSLDHLTPEKRELAEKLLAVKRAEVERNPLQNFHACPASCGGLLFDGEGKLVECPGRPKQAEFMGDPHEIVLSNAGNRFGKTTALVLFSIIQHTPEQMVPEHLERFRRPRGKPNVALKGRYMLPSEQFLQETLEEYRRWAPKSIFKNGKWADAWRGQHNILTFDDGSKLGFFTYKQDASMLAGWEGDYVLWDEPMPQLHWDELAIRTFARKGCHRVGMTPVNMSGGGIGWIKRELFDKGRPDHPEYDPGIHVVRASIHDNPDYSPEAVERMLARYPEDQRQAREHGDFIHFGGMIYPGGFERVTKPDPDPRQLEGSDIVVGIDPGLKNAAFTWHAFDRDNICLLFDEALVQEGTAIDYAKAIRNVNAKWGLREPPLYVIDPSARNRSLVNAESIEAELQRQGIYPIHGQNQVQAGVQQVRRRITEGGFFVAESCRKIRAEADEYRMEDRPDGEFRVVKENDHLLDSSRYACMSRPWYVSPEEEGQREGYSHNHAPSMAWSQSVPLYDNADF